ncbi:MAG: hypothetical protein KC636_09425 [Myxococcales bacterium]|nr:hypothetical protein [Myxococcales bacterium]
MTALGRSLALLSILASAVCSLGASAGREPPSRASEAERAALGPALELPEELGAVRQQIDDECAEGSEAPALRIETPPGGIQVSQRMPMSCRQEVSVDARLLSGGTLRIREEARGEPASCSCARILRVSARVAPGIYDVNITRAGDRREQVARRRVAVTP